MKNPPSRAPRITALELLVLLSILLMVVLVAYCLVARFPALAAGASPLG
ncbi:MAG: hypothetical protein KGH63_00465 [Candidatus Micrarchaeota archaeon]|nr:hypothetical protein [Candidatus Micrarchaeota archaeon]